MDENTKNPTTAFDLPYAMAVAGEASVRKKEDFWRFRTITNVIRQTPRQIKNYQDRYKDGII